MPRWSIEKKTEARNLRLNGASFNLIIKKLNVPKSTLSFWLKDIPRPDNLYFTNRKDWLDKIRLLAANANRKKRQQSTDKIIHEVKKDIESWEDISVIKIQKIMLALLYWAEGNKGRQVIQFANTDPRLALLFITLLRNSFRLDESKFRVRLHLHDYHQEKEVKKFWSDLLKIPESQFNKSYRKARSKEKTFRRNFGGICFIKYNSVYLQERIMQYAYLLADKFIGKVTVPVV